MILLHIHCGMRSPLVILSWLIGSSVHTWHLIISLAMYLQCTAVIVHALYIKFECFWTNNRWVFSK